MLKGNKKADATEHQRCSIASAYSLTGLPDVWPAYPLFSLPIYFDFLPGSRFIAKPGSHGIIPPANDDASELSQDSVYCSCDEDSG